MNRKIFSSGKVRYLLSLAIVLIHLVFSVINQSSCTIIASIVHEFLLSHIIRADMRIKTKFWGKSMEIQPVGTVNLKIPK